MMRRWSMGAAMAATLALAACSNDSTAPANDELADDYALVMFGLQGAALESTLGPQGGRPFDGRSAGLHLPPDLQLTDEQRAEIQALRSAFRDAHQAELDAMRAIFESARAAREGGATREEVRAILEQGRDIRDGLHAAVVALHEAILGVFTDEQRAWIESHRRQPPEGLPPRGGRGGGPGARR